MPNTTPLLTPREAAARLAIHPETLRRWTREGRVPVVRLPTGQLRFRPEDIELLTQAAS